MARVNVKYTVGAKVQTKLGKIEGIVTAIFIRGKNKAYEYSYIHDGQPTSATVEEAEIEPWEELQGIGFRKKDIETRSRL